MATNTSPLDLLLSYQRRVLDIRADIPVTTNERDEWAGLAFRLSSHVLIAPMSEVEEIVDPPDCARVPNAKPWFLGVGNVRGNLIPLTDLNSFVYDTPPEKRRNARVLTCRNGETSAGILVDEILGLRRFYVDEQTAYNGEAVPEIIDAFVFRAYQRDDQMYAVFELKEFANSNAFLNIAR